MLVLSIVESKYNILVFKPGVHFGNQLLPNFQVHHQANIQCKIALEEVRVEFDNPIYYFRFEKKK